MRHLGYIILIASILGLSACGGGSSGTLFGRVLDGFGNPLGGEAVMVTLSGNPAVNRPDLHGNFIVRAPVGDYTMRITFSNPAAGFNYRLDEQVRITKGSQQLGSFTLLNVQNMDAWESYRAKDYSTAVALFADQAMQARSATVWLPYMRYIEGDEGENSLLTQGILSAENGLGWCYTRGYGNYEEGQVHFEQSMYGGYRNYDAMVGLSGIALGGGDIETALDYLDQVIDQPGLYDSTQLHDQIREVDLEAARALCLFLEMEEIASEDAVNEIRDEVETQGNAGSKGILAMLDQFN